MQATGPDTIAKFLFTSGSTKLPKAVINTQRMWCANQQQMAQSMPVLAEAPLVLVDWLPWNHTFGGNHNFGMVVYHGGTLYIDDGKPTPALIAETLRNLREIAPTVYFNVPTGFEAIATAMKTDDALRRNLLSRVRMFFYAGAALAQPVWDSLYESEEREIGERIVMSTGLGMTESGPFGLFVTNPNVKAGDLGVPGAGPGDQAGGPARQVRGALPGPQHHARLLARACRDRRALRRRGLLLLGRRGQVDRRGQPAPGPEVRRPHCRRLQARHRHLRERGPAAQQDHCGRAPYIQDVVLTGLNMHEVGAMVFPNVLACRDLAGLPPDAPVEQVLASPGVHARFQGMLDKLSESSTGSANRISRLCLLSEPPTIDRGEITDKGSINQRAVLTHRAAIVEALHADTLPGMLKPAH
jgi:feruloyl-CoA synthase